MICSNVIQFVKPFRTITVILVYYNRLVIDFISAVLISLFIFIFEKHSDISDSYTNFQGVINSNKHRFLIIFAILIFRLDILNETYIGFR